MSQQQDYSSSISVRVPFQGILILPEENLSEENYFVVCEENFFSKSDTRL
jgi:hypothetical protein